jgi:probable DNA repair protein
MLVGFDELPPQHRQLLDTFAERGCHWRRKELISSNARAYKLPTSSVESEIRLAALWARQQAEKGDVQSIAIVVPNLQERRPTIVRIFDEHLAAPRLLEGVSSNNILSERPYNISLGISLLKVPIIQTALIILQLSLRPLPVGELTQLLCSPFLGGAETESNRRALLDATLRQLGEQKAGLSRLLSLSRPLETSTEQRSYHAPLLCQALERLSALAKQRPRRQSARAWATYFNDTLSSAGWPGERSLNSSEYQSVVAWRELLDQFCQLDSVLPNMDLSTALTWLRRMASERLFQPDGGTSPIQVLGLLEAAGLGFDRIWVMGMDDEQWPPAPRPNPFLPVLLQQQAGSPRSSAERELNVARRVTERLLNGAPRIIVSYPLRDGDRDLRPSPLISHLQVSPQAVLDQGDSFWQRIRDTARLEFFRDDEGPPLLPGSALGGSALFRDQAICPFRAFAHHRLAAQTLESVQPGLDPRDRGTLMHRMLERLWEDLGNQKRLYELEEQVLQQRIESLARETVAEQARHRPDTFTQVFSRLEQQRLGRLARSWLEVERQRAPFTVTHTEVRETVEVVGLKVRAVVDRIDRLDDDRALIIDYKSGEHSAIKWLEARPEEPQLPLYTLALEAPPAGLFFAQLKPGKMAFKGLAENGDTVDGIKAFTELRESQPFGSWDGLLEQWRRILETLAHEFMSGTARVTPKSYPDSCKYCDLATLCRINELRERLEEET